MANQRLGYTDETEILTTFAPNALPLTGYHSSAVAVIIKGNVQAAVLGLSGSSPAANVVVSAGHTHITQGDRLRWRQLASYGFNQYNGSGIDTTAEKNIAGFSLWLTPLDAKNVIPRLRCSAPGGSNIIVHVVFTFYDRDMNILLRTEPFVISTYRAFNEWIDGPTLDLAAVGAGDDDIPTRQIYFVVVSGYVSSVVFGEFLTLKEIAFGVYDL